MGECRISPVPSNVPTRFPGFGSMEGIDPYIETVGACHPTYSSVSVPFGRLGSRPYGCGIFTALLNGMYPRRNVGDDAHIVPLRGGTPPAEWGNVVFTPSHPTYRSVPSGCGSMKGIDPCIETIGASHSSIRPVEWEKHKKDAGLDSFQSCVFSVICLAGFVGFSSAVPGKSPPRSFPSMRP